MTAVTIRKETGYRGEPRYRARAGDRESIGATMGEALDALTAELGDGISEAAILFHRLQPDEYFTEAQHGRMQELLARKPTLTGAEREELEALVDAELDATVARTDSATSHFNS